MVLVTLRMWWWIAVVALALAPRLAAADKLDDAYSKTDKAWKHYDELRAGYDVLRRKWDQVYKPIDDQWKVVIAAKQAMDLACAGTGHGTQPCTNATVSWAAQGQEARGAGGARRGARSQARMHHRGVDRAEHQPPEGQGRVRRGVQGRQGSCSPTRVRTRRHRPSATRSINSRPPPTLNDNPNWDGK
jgi:hypothetical protein